METPATLIEDLFERLEAYGKTTIELSKLKAQESISHVLISLIARLSVVLTISLFVLVVNIGIALYLGEWLGKSYYGFFIVAAFYLILSIVLHLYLHKWIKKPISQLILPSEYH